VGVKRRRGRSRRLALRVVYIYMGVGGCVGVCVSVGQGEEGAALGALCVGCGVWGVGCVWLCGEEEKGKREDELCGVVEG
jgi:hypothetical protein